MNVNPDGVLSYAAEIAELMDRCLAHNEAGSSLAPLTSALGCAHVPYRKAFDYRVCLPTQPHPDDELVVAEALEAAVLQLSSNPTASISYYSDGYSVLNGLSKNGRWRDAIDRPGQAHAVAALFLYFAADFAVHTTTMSVQARVACEQLRHSVEPDVCKMLNEWLQPMISFHKCPDPSFLTRCLFGDAWFSITLTGNETPLDLSQLIRTTTPPFLPGLVAGQDLELKADLPAFDGLTV